MLELVNLLPNRQFYCDAVLESLPVTIGIPLHELVYLFVHATYPIG